MLTVNGFLGLLLRGRVWPAEGVLINGSQGLRREYLSTLELGPLIEAILYVLWKMRWDVRAADRG